MKYVFLFCLLALQSCVEQTPTGQPSAPSRSPSSSGTTSGSGGSSSSTGSNTLWSQLPVGGRFYFIPAGEHYPSGIGDFQFTSRRIGVWQAMFTKETAYRTKNPSNQADINKLVGFSDCFSLHHHRNSARFGWAWEPEQMVMKLFAYTYADGFGSMLLSKMFPKRR